jgi:hypothetical protein
VVEPALNTLIRRIDRLTGWRSWRPFRTGRVKASLFLALTLGMFVSCAPTFEKGGRSQEEFDLDSAQCLQDNSSRTAARYGPSHHVDWTGYAACMSAKGYPRQ